MNIYDCFMYFDEDLLLDLRVNILNKYVKKFVITEATYTHNGAKKKLKFDINQFQKFKDKITYIVVDEPPPNILNLVKGETEDKRGEKLILNGMARDYFQRENLKKGLENLNEEDLVIISDLDEIPNLKNLNLNKIKNNIVIFQQKMFYYKLNLFYKELVWNGSRACSKKRLKSPQWLRNIKNKKYPFWRFDTILSNKKYSNIEFVEDGGWHFTNMKSPEEIYLKLNTFLHNVDFKLSGLKLDDIKKMVKEKKILYDHFADQKKVKKWDSPVTLEAINILNLPDYVINNKNKFKDWIE